MVMTCGMVAGVDPHGMQSPEAASERIPNLTDTLANGINVWI